MRLGRGALLSAAVRAYQLTRSRRRSTWTVPKEAQRSNHVTVGKALWATVWAQDGASTTTRSPRGEGIVESGGNRGREQAAALVGRATGKEEEQAREGPDGAGRGALGHA